MSKGTLITEPEAGGSRAGPYRSHRCPRLPAPRANQAGRGEPGERQGYPAPSLHDLELGPARRIGEHQAVARSSSRVIDG